MNLNGALEDVTGYVFTPVNYHLMPYPLGIDTGDNTVVPSNTSDLDSDPDTTELMPLKLAGARRFIDDAYIIDAGVADTPDDSEVADVGACEFICVGDLDFSGFVDFTGYGVLTLAWLTGLGANRKKG